MTGADDRPLQLTLELLSGAEPITGQLSDQGGGSWRFTGWVELARALDDARTTAAGPSAGAEVNRVRPSSTT